MTVPVDPHTFTAGTTADASQVNARYLPLYTALNGALDTDNFLPAVLDKIGVSSAATIRRGKSIIATEEARTNTAYGLLTTPDRVQNVVLPTDGLIAVVYQALWKGSVATTPRAAIFLGANQIKTRWANVNAPVTQGASLSGAPTADKYRLLGTNSGGLFAARDTADTAAFTSDVTTGQVLGSVVNGFTTIVNLDDSFNVNAEPSGGGPCYIKAAAGTYDVSVQFKSSSGTVSVKDRALWVWTMGF